MNQFLPKECASTQALPKEIAQNLSCASEAEWSRFVLRALINYHDRMTMCDEKDPFNNRYRIILLNAVLNITQHYGRLFRGVLECYH